MCFEILNKMRKEFITFLAILTVLMSLNISVNAQVTLPEPVAGKSLTSKIIKNHIVYPQKALDQKKGGKVIVEFTVGRDGVAKDFKIAKSFDDECSEEALRLVKMIEWKPATDIGKPIEYQTDYTVEFSPKTYLKSESKNKRVMLPEQAYPAQTSNKIYETKGLYIQPQPYFENKQVTLVGYLRTELQYPEQAKQFEIQGTVKLNFVIETDGRASNIVVEKSVGGGGDNEAIRLVQNLLWTPGVKNDSLVRTRTSQEITFKIGERNYYDGNSY